VDTAGTNGNPVTIKFETGAKLSAPYWSANGAIALTSKDNVVIDGGTNGIIENTDNGTGKTYVAASAGVSTSLCNNLEIKNLTIQNMLLHYWADTTGTGMLSQEVLV